MEQTQGADFDRDLLRNGCGYAPNGARYLLTHYGPENFPCVERTWNGNRETILGFNGARFESLDAARYWANSDGRYEMKPGAPLSDRKQLD